MQERSTKNQINTLKMNLKTILFLLISTITYSQTNKKILLEWKLSKNDTLKYKTSMNVIQQKNKNTSKDSSDNDFTKIQKLLSEVNSNTKYQTKLFINNKNENLIDIEMLAINDEKDSNLEQIISEIKEDSEQKSKKKKKKKTKTEEIKSDSLNINNLYKSLASLNGNVVLRGRISKTGEIISTFYKNSQKNLIAILFELPNKPVEIGEKWKLNNVSLIEMDQNFVCDSLSNENTVYIEQIIESDTDKIAVIKYDINEYVIGDFNNPMGGMFGMDESQKTFMRISHTATAHFSLLKGKWISYEGLMEVESNFAMFGGKAITEFKLLE